MGNKLSNGTPQPKRTGSNMCTSAVVPLVFHCGATNPEKRGIVLKGCMFDTEGGRGSAHALGIGSFERAILFSIGGYKDDLNIRFSQDEFLALAVDWNKFEHGNKLSLYGNKDHPEWCTKFTFNPDGTLSPLNGPHLVLGCGGLLREDLVLVPRNDLEHRCVFINSTDAIEEHTRLVVAVTEERFALKQMLQQRVDASINSNSLQQLKQDGYIHLPGLVDSSLIKPALKEFVRNMQALKAIKGNSIPSSSRFITDLYSESAIPYAMKKLFCLDANEGAAMHQSAGQLAPRFPGDMLPPVEHPLAGQELQLCTLNHWNEHRKHWHLDGCASEFKPGESDHYGRVGVFDALVGVLLNDVDEEMSGELCCYPGSHYALADYFKHKGVDNLYLQGSSALPSGSLTDDVLLRPPVHCIGKAGDVFILNFMTAHFVAPNTSPFIRYAVYFRPTFSSTIPKGHNVDAPAPSLTDPWVHWELLRNVKL